MPVRALSVSIDPSTAVVTETALPLLIRSCRRLSKKPCSACFELEYACNHK